MEFVSDVVGLLAPGMAPAARTCTERRGDQLCVWLQRWAEKPDRGERQADVARTFPNHKEFQAPFFDCRNARLKTGGMQRFSSKSPCNERTAV